jgi:pyoverdine/dityrosine biosynthesis protein
MAESARQGTPRRPPSRRGAGERPGTPWGGGRASAIAAERVLQLLSSSRYRKGSLEQMEFARCRSQLLATLRRCTRAGAPVRLTLMAFPFKVPNPAKVGSRTLPDLAELTAIRWCQALGARIAEIYAPGLRLEIIHDGALIAEVFGVGLAEVRAYEEYFGRLVRAAGAEGAIRCHDFDVLQRRTGLDPSPALDHLREEAAHWWRSARHTPGWRACFSKTLGMLQLRELSPRVAGRLLQAAARGSLPPEYVRVEERVHEAMIAYRLKNAVIHCFDPRAVAFPDAIHATTRVQPGRLALWLIRRGSGLLPWHGVGAVDDAGWVRVALAEQVADRPDMRAVVLPGEDTPFCYAPLNGRTDPAALLPA